MACFESTEVQDERDRDERRRRQGRDRRRRAAHRARSPGAQERARPGRRSPASCTRSSSPRSTTRCASSCCAARASDFCTGADWVATNRGGRPAPAHRQHPAPHPARRRIASSSCSSRSSCRSSASVRGWAAGLGCQIALAADFTIAAESSRFWEPFLERGFSPDSGATWLVPRLVGIARAKELLLLGRKVTGAEAAGWGLDPPRGARRRARRRPSTSSSRSWRPRPPSPSGSPSAASTGRSTARSPTRWRPRRTRSSSAPAAADFKEGHRGLPGEATAALRGPVAQETARVKFESIRYEVADRIATITFDRPDQLNALSPGDDRRAARGLRPGRSRPRRLDPARHRQRARVLRRRRRQRDPRRRAGRLRRAVPLDLRAVGGAAGGHAAVPHDDEADPHRGQRAVLRRRARPRHDRRHRHRVRPRRVLRPAREHRPGVGPRDGAARARAADEHRHARSRSPASTSA